MLKSPLTSVLKNIDTIEYCKFASFDFIFSDTSLLQMTIFYLETLVYTCNFIVEIYLQVNLC